MELETKYFGLIRCDDKSTLAFPDGVFGFDDEKEFLLIPFDGGDESLLCLQSTKTPGLAFVAVNPFYFWAEYAPVLTERELALMSVNCSEDLCYYTFCVVKDPLGSSTLNLKCPIVINDETRQARQVILDQYEMRHLLSEFQGKEEAPC